MEQDKIKAAFAEFERHLSALTTVSGKVQHLTSFATKQRAFAEYIAKQILNRARKSGPQDIAPLCLIDSISKTGVQEYAKHFAPHLVDIFCAVFENGTKETKRNLLMMYKTWDCYYPQEILKAISNRVRLPEIEKLILTGEDYDRIDAFNRSKNPSLYHRPAAIQQRPMQPPTTVYPSLPNMSGYTQHIPYGLQQSLIPTIAPPPPPPVASYTNPPPTAGNYVSMRPGSHLPSPVSPIIPSSAVLPKMPNALAIGPGDGPFATIYKKFRNHSDRISYVPISLGNPASLNQRNDKVLQLLYYDEGPFQCKLCGVKHDTLSSLRDHLDKHFVITRNDKFQKVMAQTRASFQPKDVWVMGIEREEYRETQQVHLVPYQEALKTCHACHYPFEVAYSRKEKGWVFTNAFEVALDDAEERKEGDVVLMHKACLKGFMIAQKEEDAGTSGSAMNEVGQQEEDKKELENTNMIN